VGNPGVADAGFAANAFVCGADGKILCSGVESADVAAGGGIGRGGKFGFGGSWWSNLFDGMGEVYDDGGLGGVRAKGVCGVGTTEVDLYAL
jgi:hypothetical protein